MTRSGSTGPENARVGRYLELLRQRDFALLWGGATISLIGDGMSFVALIWLVIQRGGTPADVGWLAAIYTAPVVVGGLAAGIVLDAFDPRRVLAADNAIRGLAVASVPVASALGIMTTPHLFVVAGIYGLLYMASTAGIPSLITRLVRGEDLTTANAMESLSFSVAGLAGPVVAGVLIAVVGAPFVLAIDAVTYLVFVVCLLAMREGGRAAMKSASHDVGAPGVTESEPTSAPLTAWARTIRMRFIPPDLRGRVFALLRTSMQSTRPLGAVAAGLLLTGGDLTTAIVLVVLMFVVPGLIGIWLPALGRGPTAEPNSA